MTTNHQHRKHRAAPAATGMPETQTPTPADRVVSIPATPLATLTPCSGDPDLFSTRLLHLVLILLFGGFLVALPVAFALDRTVHIDLVGGLLLLLVMAVCGWCLSIPVQAWRNAGGWFFVDENGFRYGFGRPRGTAREAMETRVAWQDVVCNPELRYDVTTGFTGRNSLVKELRFWQRLPSGERVQQRLPLRLANGMQCLRFRNRAELLRAVLRGLASRPELRFDADVFVDACIDPQTWRPMPGPRVYLYAPLAILCVLVPAFLWYTLEVWPLWLVITLSVGVPIALCVLMANRWVRAYPNLQGVISFRADEPF